jgi:hypothetical protein
MRTRNSAQRRLANEARGALTFAVGADVPPFEGGAKASRGCCARVALAASFPAAGAPVTVTCDDKAGIMLAVRLNEKQSSAVATLQLRAANSSNDVVSVPSEATPATQACGMLIDSAFRRGTVGPLMTLTLTPSAHQVRTHGPF